MTVTLIGSQAMKIHFPDAREPKDWDYYSDKPTRVQTEPELAGKYDVFVDPRLAEWPWGAVATPDELYTMKISHGYWDINGTWDKHAADIVFLQRKGCKLIPELHDLLKDIWAGRYKKNPISLDKSADAFFTDHVVKKFVHDTVHKSIAYRHRPWYLEYLKEGSEVLVDNKKFWALPEADQLQALREEFYVIALERKLIPADYTGSPLGAYRWALRRSAISLFKNRWATFILLHLDELGRPDCDYAARHKANSHMLVLDKRNSGQ
jgi:hypothetical protein